MLHKKGFKILAVVLVIFIAIFFVSAIANAPSKSDTMTFKVRIPTNTPLTDKIYVSFGGTEPLLMEKENNFLYKLDVRLEQVNPEDGIIRYRYVRNGYDFATAEYLEPDTNDHYWTKRGREIEFEVGETHEDSIERWRWFPTEDIPIVKTTTLEPDRSFLPRINGLEFQARQVIEDLYHESYYAFFDSTATHMKEVGYSWVEIDPPWQWTEVNGLPKVENQFETNPNYPTDEKFIEEVLAYKNQGLKVALQPQICCNEISMENRSQEWWDAYFSETTKFLVHFAKLGEQSGADALHYAIGSGETQYPEQWREVFREVKRNFSGQVGQMVWSFGTETGKIIPTANDILWGDELDYFYVAIDAPISLSDNPTDVELKAGADKMLDGTKELYDKFGKPVIVRTTYFNAKQTWKGASFYTIADVPWQGDEEKELVNGKYQLGPEDLARTVHAYWQSIADRPWIIGYGQFGYGHWENPLSSELSVRGKPAENVWGKWIQKIKQQ